MKILLVAEKEGTAIHRLCEMTVKSAPWHEFRIVCVHPKRPNQLQLKEFSDGMDWCDIIDFRYWRTAELMRSMFDITKPMMLTHYNPYNIKLTPVADYKINVVVNTEQQKLIRNAPSTLIPLPIDLDFWKFQDPKRFRTHEGGDRVLMVANRIEGKKGIEEVARACNELGIEFRLVGNISDNDYFERVKKAGGDHFVFFQNISNEELRSIYWMSSIHVCNSIDGYESGTMPILEAMATGCPVLTRNVGHVPDIFDGRNMVVRMGDVNDVEEIKRHLSEMLADSKHLLEIRNEARFALRRRGLELYGWQYSRLYHRLVSQDHLVSVVMPICGNPERWMRAAAAVLTSDYHDIELILCDDSIPEDVEVNAQTIKDFRHSTGATIKHIPTATFKRIGDEYVKVYGIANARNAGIREAEGRYICFVDDQIEIDSHTITAFTERIRPATWLWGIKDGVRKGFVENLSMVYRDDIIRIGSFSSQITQYGGMTQEVRRRAELNKITFELVEGAIGTRVSKSSSKHGKAREIALSKAQCYKLFG